MSQEYNPLDPINRPRDAVDFMDKMNKAQTAAEASKTRKLLEEQARLQQESLALQKQRLALEQERLKLEREQPELQKREKPASIPQPVSPSPPDEDLSQESPSEDYCQPRFFGWMKDKKAIRNEKDPYRKQQMQQEFNARYSEPDRQKQQIRIQDLPVTHVDPKEFMLAAERRKEERERKEEQKREIMRKREEEREREEERKKGERTNAYKEVFSLFHSRNYDEAMGKCDSLLNTILRGDTFLHAETLLLRAMIWSDCQSYINAIEDCTRAIAIDPTLQAAYWGRGTAFKHLIENASWIKLEWRKSAIADFSKVQPDNPHFHEAKQAVLEMESGSYLFNMLIHQFVTYLTYPIHLLFGNR